MLSYLDCQAQAIGSGGYQALAAPGSTASIVLTALLTIFAALFGFRMLLGQTPAVRDGVLALVKIGAVLALATSWPAYQVLIYDVILKAPAQIASEIGGPAGIVGARGGLSGRLDNVDQAFDALAVAGAGFVPPNVTIANRPAPPLFIGFDTFALGASRVVFLASSIAAFAIVRLAAGLLLALGPLFIAFLLFDGTRGLFEGWARGLVGAALGALATSIALGVELTLLEPWLYDLLARRAAEQPILGAPAQLLAITTVFAVVLASLMMVVGRVAMGLRLPTNWLPERILAMQPQGTLVSVATNNSRNLPTEARSRAAAVVDAVAANQRREEFLAVSNASVGGARMARPTNAASARDGLATIVTPRVQNNRRRPTNRVSSSAGSRDKRL